MLQLTLQQDTRLTHNSKEHTVAEQMASPATRERLEVHQAARRYRVGVQGFIRCLLAQEMNLTQGVRRGLTESHRMQMQKIKTPTLPQDGAAGGGREDSRTVHATYVYVTTRLPHPPVFPAAAYWQRP